MKQAINDEDLERARSLERDAYYRARAMGLDLYTNFGAFKEAIRNEQPQVPHDRVEFLRAVIIEDSMHLTNLLVRKLTTSAILSLKDNKLKQVSYSLYNPIIHYYQNVDYRHIILNKQQKDTKGRV